MSIQINVEKMHLFMKCGEFGYKYLIVFSQLTSSIEEIHCGQ